MTIAPPELLVGFDLDMTLIDSRPGIAAAFRALSALTGVAIDGYAAAGRLGPPLAVEIARWFPADDVPDMVATYRALYPDHAIAPSRLLPGARAAVAAVHAAGGRVLVVTAKHEPLARLHLEHLSLAVDAVIGDVWAEAKGAVLQAASAYVGDHVGDVRAARAAGTRAVAVATGPCSEAELRAAGADHVLPDLTVFPALLAGLTSPRHSRPSAGPAGRSSGCGSACCRPSRTRH
jgi:phosphoglycolate phosphatase